MSKCDVCGTLYDNDNLIQMDRCGVCDAPEPFLVDVEDEVSE